MFDLGAFEESAEQPAHLAQVEIVETESLRRHRRWWVPYAALVGVLAAAGIGLFGAQWSVHRHQVALEQQADGMSGMVAEKAGSGVFDAFVFGSVPKTGTLTLTGPTTFYVACANGQAVLGPFTDVCDGKPTVYGPYGTRGTIIHVSLPGSPWAFTARPLDQRLETTTPIPQQTVYR